MTVLADTDGLSSQLCQQLHTGHDAPHINELGDEESFCHVPDPFKTWGWKGGEEKKRIAPPGSWSRAVQVQAKGEGLGRGLLSHRSWGCDREEDIR